VEQVCQRQSAGLGDLVIVTSLQELSKQQLPGDGAYDAVVSVSASGASHSLHSLSTLLALAKPGATVVVQEPVAASPSEGMSTADKLQQLVLLAGLSDGEPSPQYSLAVSPALSGREGVINAAVQARKPSWASGAQQPIRRKLGGKANGAAVGGAVKIAAADASAAWGAAAMNDTADLIDDEDLLTEEDRVRPEAPVAADCSTSRKACKDCSCGRAEAEAAGAPPPQLTKEMLENPGAEGGCGSCALGDAFRCASCPYRGLPTFQKGVKIELPAGFLAEDL